MESNFEGDVPIGNDNNYSGDQAREVLAGLNADGARLAERIVTPPWYHPLIGLIVAVLVLSQALPGSYSLLLMVPPLVALPILAITYTQKYGVSLTRPTGPHSKRFLYAMITVLVLTMIAAALIKLNNVSLWWVCIPVVVATTAVVVLGRRYDSALRTEVAEGIGPRS
ncbi:MAG: hypothetical protein ACTIJ6_08425 [Leucobacter sp.]